MTASDPTGALRKMYESFPFPQREEGPSEVGVVLADRLVHHGFSGQGRWLDLGTRQGSRSLFLDVLRRPSFVESAVLYLLFAACPPLRRSMGVAEFPTIA